MRDEIQIKLVDDTLPLPEFKTAGAAAFDLYARTATEIPAGAVRRIPLNVVIIPPKGYWILLAARSSLHKKGLMMANGVGIMDADFCGEDDEYQGAVYNFSDADVTIDRGERIIQATLLPLFQPQIVPVTSVATKSRGAFGSTGTHA